MNLVHLLQLQQQDTIKLAAEKLKMYHLAQINFNLHPEPKIILNGHKD